MAASMIAATLQAWLRHLALDGDLAKAEPKTLRYLRPARRRPDHPRRPAPAPADRRDLALGAGHRGRPGADLRPGPGSLITCC
jgi:hypothetical protein